MYFYCFFCMNHQVIFEFIFPGKTLWTHCAFKWFLSGVGPKVFLKGTRPSKTTKTNETYKWFLFGVCNMMSFEMCRVHERFLTKSAGKNSFSSVKYLMLLYMDRIWKTVFTLWAIKIIFFLCCFLCSFRLSSWVKDLIHSLVSARCGSQSVS